MVTSEERKISHQGQRHAIMSCVIINSTCYCDRTSTRNCHKYHVCTVRIDKKHMQHKVHRRFVGHTLGYQGEGPDTEGKAPAEAAKNLSGGKRNVSVLECPGGREVEIENRSEDECEDELAETLSDIPDADIHALWTGDDMYSFGSDATETGSMLGSINFFNIDGIKYGSNAVGAVVAKNRRTKCIVSSIVDNRSDWVNRGSRVEQPFNQAYGGPNSVKFSHSSTKHSSRLPDIGECVTAAMPEVRNRAGKGIRDNRGWGRYAGMVIDGRYEGGEQRKLAIIGVYAACGKDSSAGRTQAACIVKMQTSKDDSVRRVSRGKTPFTMMLHDLEVEIRKLQGEGCTIIVGGDFNQREYGGGVGWEQLVKWREKMRLGDVLRTMHPGQEFVTYRANGKYNNHTQTHKKIATWVDHCFASNVLIQNEIIVAAGVLDLGKYYQNAKLANSMHNMLSIGIDYGRALNIKSAEINTSEKFEYEGRMRYIYIQQDQKGTVW